MKNQMRCFRTLVAVTLAAVSIGWLDPYATARQGNGLFKEGKYEDAVSKYNEALVDRPDSPQLHFNLGDAQYKQGKYDEALKTFQQVPSTDDDPARTARVAYNVGNIKYRLAQAAESSDPKAALTSYAEALIAYRRAMGAAPNDMDIKFNHEFAEQKLAELKKKLEEQQKQQEQQNQQNQDQQQDQQKQDQQKQQDQQQQAQNEPKKEEKDQQQQQAQQQERQAAGGAQEQADAEKKDGEMSRQEAVAVLDSQRDQEVKPDEVVKKLQGAVVAEPAQDW